MQSQLDGDRRRERVPGASRPVELAALDNIWVAVRHCLRIRTRQHGRRHRDQCLSSMSTDTCACTSHTRVHPHVEKRESPLHPQSMCFTGRKAAACSTESVGTLSLCLKCLCVSVSTFQSVAECFRSSHADCVGGSVSGSAE